MHRKLFTRIGINFLISCIIIVISTYFLPRSALAQVPAPFLSPPYYGTKGISSYFDHNYPTQVENQNVRYYDGRLGTTANCDQYFAKAYATTAGQCLYYDGHEGIDYGSIYEPVLAAESGIVTRASWWNATNRDSAYGLVIEIRHSNNYITRYAHLSAVAVALNQQVESGQIIGTSGNTGYSTAAHLHFQVLNPDDKTIDPFGWTGSGADPWQIQSGAASYCLWKDGEWANYCGGVSRPIPVPVNGGEIIVDDTTNNSGGFRKGSGGYAQNVCTNNCQNWTAGTSGYSSDMYSTPADRVNNTPDQWAEWTPSGIPTDGGIYEVQVYVPSANATSWQAPYIIRYVDSQGNSTTATATVDQYGLSNQWVSIGTYRMKSDSSVWTHDATGEANAQHCSGGWCQLGVDAVKFIRRGTVYAPNVRYNSSSWQSSLIIRNNGGGPATTYTKFFKSDGTNACNPAPFTLVAHQTDIVTCGSSQVASAIVEGSQDLSVVVRTANGGLAHLDNASMPGSTGDPAFEQTATALYVPAIYNNIFGGINSTVHIQNAGSVPTNVTLTYTPRTGYICSPCSINFTVAANGKASQAASAFVGGSASVGSLKITAPQPLAVAIEESQGSAISRSFSGVASGHLRTYVPAAYNNQFGFLTGLVIQNLHTGSSTNVTLTYYDRNGAVSATQQISNLASQKAVGVNLSAVSGLPNPWTGSVKIESSGNIPLGTAVTNSNSVGGYDFNATNKGSKVVVLPFAVKNASGTACSWCTGYTVRNVSTSPNVTVVAQYYDNNGTPIWSRTFTLGSAAVAGFHQSLDGVPNGWQGSIVLSASDVIVAIMREDTSSTVNGYNGIPR